MIMVNFRLESFSTAAEGLAEVTHRQDIDRAFDAGLAEGRALGFSAELRALTEALQAVEQAMSETAAIRAEAERQTLEAVLPLLQEIVTALAAGAEPAGVEAALRDEMLRLVGQAAPPGWHVLSPPAMEAMIRRCARSAGIDAVDLRVDAAITEAEIVLDQGRSVFSQAQVADRFRDLIAELQEGYR